jgi:diaminopimelate epimerase
MSHAFVKGHGTENDFVVVPAEVDLTPDHVRALCDRRAGIGGDGVIRAVRDEDGRWFMDYRNADGSTSEMCGNGIRVYARYLRDREGATFPLEIATCDGVKVLTEHGDGFTADMGTPRVLGTTTVGVGDRTWEATHVDMGNPHAVAFVGSLADAGTLHDPPSYDPAVYPEGVNVEFVVRESRRHVAMRVHERGSGETRSCGTGACAVMVAAALADGVGAADGSGEVTPPMVDTSYSVEVPGGDLTVTWTRHNRLLLTGPAELVADGTTDL